MEDRLDIKCLHSITSPQAQSRDARLPLSPASSAVCSCHMAVPLADASGSGETAPLLALRPDPRLHMAAARCANWSLLGGLLAAEACWVASRVLKGLLAPSGSDQSEPPDVRQGNGPGTDSAAALSGGA